MKISLAAKSPLAALGLFLVAALAVPHVIRGEEPKQRCELRVEVRGEGLPLLTKVPYFGKLFSQSQECQQACPAASGKHGECPVAEGKVIEFGFSNAPCQICPLPARAVIVAHHAEECGDCTCAAAKECCAKAVTVTKTGACCQAAGCCKDGACCKECPCATAVSKQAGCCQEQQAHWEEIAEMAAENAALQATLESQEAVLETKAEMFESLAELMVEKAKLEAKLEMVEHRDEMLKELVALHAENSKLKLEVQLSKEREEMAKVQLATMMENERLKQRVTELEQKQLSAEKPLEPYKTR